MLEAAAQAVQDGGHSVLMIDAPTGSGKTAILSALLAARGDKRIVVALRTVSQVSIYLEEISKIRQHKNTRPRVAYLVGKAKTCQMRDELDNVYLGCDILKIKTRNLLESKIQEYMATTGKSLDAVYDPSKDSELIDSVNKEMEGDRSCCPYYLLSREAYFSDKVIKFRASKNARESARAIGDKVIYPDELSHHCKEICPYELMALSAEDADVVILNYNHVFNDTFRDTMYGWLGIKPDECILIIDEAHNLGESVRAVNSDVLTQFSVNKAINEIGSSRSLAKKAGLKENLAVAEQILPRILKFLEKIGEKANFSEEWFDPHMFSDFIFGESLVREDEKMVAEMMSLAEVITKYKQNESEFSQVHLKQVGEFLFMLNFAKKDEAYIPLKYTQERKVGRHTYTSPALEIRNIDPCLKIESIIDIHHATIMLSGTFSPPDAYELYYFGKNGRATIIRLPNQFPPQNRLILAASTATTRNIRRNDPDNITLIRKHIGSFINNVPGNVVVYFTSYNLLDQYLDFCTSSAKTAGKRIYLEPREAQKVAEILSQFFQAGYKRAVKPGVLLAVAGGKMSEGIDYRGEALKGAMVVGLPLFAYTETQKSINEYYKNKYGKKKGLFIAYTLPAINRAIQALGRVHRSAQEDGVLVLCDERFASSKGMGVREYLPEWMDNEMKVCSPEQSTLLISDWVQHHSAVDVTVEIEGSEDEKHNIEINTDTETTIKCPECKRNCKFKWQVFKNGTRHIRQCCPVHGHIKYAPRIEPYITIADQNKDDGHQKKIIYVDN
jgi:DNA excision repair protein ERCC-2